MPGNNEEMIVAAVDIGTTKVCTVIAEVKEDEINVMGVGWQENCGVQKGSVINIADTVDAISKSVKKAEEMANVQVDGVLASISGRHIAGIKGHGVTALSHTKQKEITEGDIERAMEGATNVPMPQDKEKIHVLPVQYIVDSQDEIENPLGMTGLKLEVDAYVITGSVTAVENIKKVVEKAGYSVEDVILQSLASANAVLYKDEKEVGVLVLDIGGGTTDMALYYKGALRFARVIPFGGQLITNDLVKALQTPKVTAEEIKKKYGLYTGAEGQADELVDVVDMGNSKVSKIEHSRLNDYIKPRIIELVKLVEAELEREGIDRGMYAGGIVLTGGTSLLKGIDEAMKEELGIRVRVGAPLKEKVVGLYDIVSTPEYSTVIGLIDYYMKDRGVSNMFMHKNGFFQTIASAIKKLLTSI